jgi:hypothetical protein
MPKKSSSYIIEEQERIHKPLPTFEWHGPLENYYRDGECYYTRIKIRAVCNISGDESMEIYGNGKNSINLSLLKLTKSCTCGANWHYII